MKFVSTNIARNYISVLNRESLFHWVCWERRCSKSASGLHEMGTVFIIYRIIVPWFTAKLRYSGPDEDRGLLFFNNSLLNFFTILINSHLENFAKKY